MAASTSIRINQDLYEQAKQDAMIEHRTIAGQIEFWAITRRPSNPTCPRSLPSISSQQTSVLQQTLLAPEFIRIYPPSSKAERYRAK